MKNFKLFIIGLVILLLAACYTTPYGIYDLKVADESAEKLWLKGKELLKISNNDAEVIVNYDTSRQGLLLFDVSIYNISDEIILISPEDFYCDTVTILDDEIQIKAVNPEEMIYKYNKRIAEIEATQISDAKTNLLFSMFEVADTFRDKTDEEREKERIERRDREESQERRDKYNKDTREEMFKEKEFYEVQSLRKTSLLPGQKIGGRIYFKVRGKLKDFSLNIPIKDDNFKIKYNVNKM